MNRKILMAKGIIRSSNSCLSSGVISHLLISEVMAIRDVEFSNGGYKIRKIFA